MTPQEFEIWLDKTLRKAEEWETVGLGFNYTGTKLTHTRTGISIEWWGGDGPTNIYSPEGHVLTTRGGRPSAGSVVYDP